MSKKTLRCYELNVTIDGKTCEKENFKDLIKIIFDQKQNDEAAELINGNKIIKYKDEKNNSFSLELLNIVNGIKINENYMFFRIGKQKDIEGFVKRNRSTLLGEGVLDEDQQRIYELEVCTYILIDIREGIILEMYGQYAPNIRILTLIINRNIQKIDDFNNLKTNVSFKNIMTEKMIETFKNNGNKLGKIGYTYSIPNAKKLASMGMGLKQIEALNLLGSLELDLIIKNKPRIPLTKKNEIISMIVSSFGECVKDIKESLFFEGSTKDNSSRKFTFDKEEVTYNLDVAYYKNEDGVKIPLTLEQIEEQVYEKIKLRYENNKGDILTYI
ncbi:Uncharacterised protein [Clostridium carnis]|uniref:Uncharacterized protein n=1 Tax=Clostridium carnis TaxID=1530 RepID=A0ABY6T0Y1_9CLOT|nr:hypothetical protein [Clostridium carnis]VDG74723.1 Uncharacterised protein [Clostridium carnis]